MVQTKIQVEKLADLVGNLLQDPSSIPLCDLISGTIDGRSGTLSVQAE